MNKSLLSIGCGVLAAVAVFGWNAQPARAVKEFKDQFEAKYVKAGSAEAKDVALKAAVEKAKCNICHAGTSKKDRNAYGKALDALLDRKADKENKQKIVEALDKVAGMKCKEGDPNCPTFGQLIDQGKLPCEE